MALNNTNGNTLCYEKAIVFQDHLIVPFGSRYCVLDPIGLVLADQPATIEQAYDLVVDMVIRNLFESQISLWKAAGLITEVMAQVMKADINELV
jgi:hypothetical protein